ncbi:MAG: hypothetical protein GYB67_16150 [Chloroflexi bacterium]|nr:hypothetical protein [Chloroflexota bacterium]
MARLNSDERRPRSVFAGVLRITVIVIVLSVGLYLFLQNRYENELAACQTRTLLNEPVYPGATEVNRETYMLTSPFGIVETWIELASPDAPETVRAWYQDTIPPLTPEAIIDPSLIPADRWAGEWDVQAGAGSGAQIVLISRCP